MNPLTKAQAVAVAIDIVDDVCTALGVNRNAVLHGGARKKADVVAARWKAIWRIRHSLVQATSPYGFDWRGYARLEEGEPVPANGRPVSTPFIGDVLGLNHTTVVLALLNMEAGERLRARREKAANGGAD